MINYQALLKSPAIRKVSKDTFLSREGNKAFDSMYYVVFGNIALHKQYTSSLQQPVAICTAGEFFGDECLLLGKRPEFTAVALTDSIVLVLDSKTAAETIAANPDLALDIMAKLSKRQDRSIAIGTGTATAAEQSQPDASAANEPLTEPAAIVQQASGSSELFPEEHGSYLLPVSPPEQDGLYINQVECALCGKSFEHLSVITSKLRLDRTTDDMRSFYKDLEPLHYEVITCPHCYYSAFSDQFDKASARISARVVDVLAPFCAQNLPLKTGAGRDTFTIFAGFYLAILCAPICFDDPELTVAKLWNHLGWLYQDAEDPKMLAYAAERALERYKYSYEHLYLSEKQSQQICYVMGTLYEKLGDIENAKNSYYYAKSNRGGTAVIKRQASNRLDALREQKQDDAD